MLVTNIISFYNNVFYSLKVRHDHLTLATVDHLSANAFNLVQSSICYLVNFPNQALVLMSAVQVL